MFIDVLGKRKNEVGSMPRAREAHSRSLLKAVSWRITGTIDTFIISLIVTGKTNNSGFDCGHGIIHQNRTLLWSRTSLVGNSLGTSLNSEPEPISR